MVACLAGCGKISFGVDLGGAPDAAPARDAEVVPDVGFPDTGVVDTGVTPVPDGGGEEPCLPVTVPSTFPAAWPFGDTRSAYEEVFWQWASTQGSQCSASVCHGGPNPPRIPTGGNLGDEYERGISELWPYLKDENTQYGGRLWRHHPDYDGPGGHELPNYEPAQVQFLKDLLHSAWACHVAPELARQDAGPECGPEPDSGVPPADAGVDEDGGGVDAGAPDAGRRPPCYCDVPDVGPLNTQYCAQ